MMECVSRRGCGEESGTTPGMVAIDMITENIAAKAGNAGDVPPGHVRFVVHGGYWLGLMCLVHIGFGHVHGADDITVWPAAGVIAFTSGVIAAAYAFMEHRLAPLPAGWFCRHLRWHRVSWSVVMYVSLTGLAIHGVGHRTMDFLPSVSEVLLRSPLYIAAVAGVWFAYRMVCGYGAYLTKTSPERCMLGTRSDFEQLLQHRH